MEGYSVTEAASVLGVPTERVWELLARGVLSGAPEGETGMRVYLQPRPAPTPPVAEPPRTNGHGDPEKADAEASPFRELLTEFRNLTERYGQALLALGEARGEVASLRSRVDVLEARMDLRLPFGGVVPTPSPAPNPPSPAPRRDDAPAATAPPTVAKESSVAAEETREAEPEADHEPEADRSVRRRRTRAQFVEDFADALARAEDPNPAELPGGVEAGAAFAALQAVVAPDAELEASDPAADAGLPRELPTAEPMIETEVGDGPSAGQPPEMASEVGDGTVEPEPEQEVAVARAEPEASPAPADDEQGLDATAESAEPDKDPEPEVDPSAAVATPAVEAPADPTPSDEPPAAWDRDRYTAVIEEPDWWTPDAAGWDDPLPKPSAAAVAPEPELPSDAEADAETAAEPADAEPDVEASADVPGPEVEAEPEPVPRELSETGSEQPVAEESPSPSTRAPNFAASLGLDLPLDAEPAVTEETMLWFGSRPEADPVGQDAAAEMEIASTGRPTAGGDRPKPLPGAAELDDAVAALSNRSRTDPDPGAAKSEVETPPPPRPAPAPNQERARPVELPSPASRAYRRLRRIFPN